MDSSLRSLDTGSQTWQKADGMTDNSSDKSVGRRGVLKGAVAAGVGVAAWSTPSITSIGGTPVYAAACTSPVFYYEAGSRNTDCGGCTGSIRYKQWDTSQCSGTPFPGTATLTTSTGGAPPQAGLCPPNAYVTVTGAPASQYCVVRVAVYLGNCSGTFITGGSTPPFSGGGGTVPLPPVNCSPPNNKFLRVQVVCSDQLACLP